MYTFGCGQHVGNEQDPGDLVAVEDGEKGDGQVGNDPYQNLRHG
jgi:hypothetical protein